MTENTILKHREELQGTAKCIVDHDVNSAHGAKVYANLVENARLCIKGYIERTGPCEDGEELANRWICDLEDAEETILGIRAKEGEKVVTKGGKWIRSKVSQNSTYRSNKSVIISALKNNISITDINDNPVPKSQLEKIIKEKVGEKDPDKTALEKALTQVNNLGKLIPKLDVHERERVVLELNNAGVLE